MAGRRQRGTTGKAASPSRDPVRLTALEVTDDGPDGVRDGQRPAAQQQRRPCLKKGNDRDVVGGVFSKEEEQNPAATIATLDTYILIWRGHNLGSL